jgi:peptidylprolyl isomerase
MFCATSQTVAIWWKQLLHQQPKVISVRLSRLRVVSAAVIPLVFLAACGSSKTDGKPSPLDVVSVGGTAKAPTVVFEKKPLTVQATTTRVVTPGKGPALTKTNAVTFNYVLVNGKNGKQIDTSFGKRPAGMDLSSPPLPGLSKGVVGQQVGSRLLVAMPAADGFGPQGNPQAGFGPSDTVLLLIDVVSASTPLKTATGDPVTPRAGLPTVKVDAKGVPVVTVPKTPPPAKLVIQPLIKGKGPAVKAGQLLTANYVGLVYGTGKVFDSSYKSGNRLKQTVGAGQLVPGFDKGIVGQTVGSRVLLVMPPADGYGKTGNPSAGIKGTDTIVFVVDILSAA